MPALTLQLIILTSQWEYTVIFTIKTKSVIKYNCDYNNKEEISNFPHETFLYSNNSCCFKKFSFRKLIHPIQTDWQKESGENSKRGREIFLLPSGAFQLRVSETDIKYSLFLQNMKRRLFFILSVSNWSKCCCREVCSISGCQSSSVYLNQGCRSLARIKDVHIHNWWASHTLLKEKGTGKQYVAP